MRKGKSKVFSFDLEVDDLCLSIPQNSESTSDVVDVIVQASHSDNSFSKLENVSDALKFLSVLDPTQMCSYISEVLDAGVLGPLFKVSVESAPLEAFTDVSATQCWEKAIESLDPQHRCSEYWLSKQDQLLKFEREGLKLNPQFGNPSEASMKLFGIDLTRPAPKESTTNDETVEEVQCVLRGLFNKASLDELKAMQKVLSGESHICDRRVALATLVEEMQKKLSVAYETRTSIHFPHIFGHVNVVARKVNVRSIHLVKNVVKVGDSIVVHLIDATPKDKSSPDNLALCNTSNYM
ncbi:putative lysine-specific demethylase JMJ14 [Acorus calamus]|uniref:Lysine-specific demethylase JMJ14 n=1 Tax=Acorus calamus TaxID=4465 RepID=A0AAV9E391_ACOCL|nr:putative lysine-specific demethylase JMJ14 [Acorus calamus]